MVNKKIVLIVDENRAFVASVQEMLDSRYESHAAKSAMEALEMAEKVKPDIVFLEIILPDKEGYEICGQLKKSAKGRPMEIILMSGEINQGHLERIISVGADDFIRKPFDKLEFHLRLHAAKIRLESQEKLIREREFYRYAVRQEESLSKKLLDQQFDLREALSSMEKNKDKLELENSKLLVASRYDVLTGLLNKSSLHARVKLELQRVEGEEESLYGIMIDLDHFKSINDSYGHLVGDELLHLVGEVLRSCTRKGDFAGRYGGDEFFIVLKGLEEAIALQIAERIRTTIDEISIDSNGIEVGITASIGVAVYKIGEHMDDFIEKVDKAMYMAKSSGRNKVVFEP